MNAYIRLFEHVPGFVLRYFEWARINVNRDAEFALETFWHSPRVPAGSASAKLEAAGVELAAGFIEYGEFRLCRVSAVFADDRVIMFTVGSDDPQA